MRNQFRIIALLLALAIMPNGHSQTLREQLQQKKDELLSGGSASKSVSEMPTEGQLEIATKWETGEYDYFKRDGNGNSFVRDGTMNIRIIKNEDGTIKTVRLGEESQFDRESNAYNPYSFGGSEFVCAFVMNNSNCIYFTDEMIVHYSCDNDYNVWTVMWSLNKKKKYNEFMTEIQAYRDYGENQIEGDRVRVKEEEIANRKEFTLEGKDVVSITPIYPNGKPIAIGVNESIDIGFEIKLADGTVMKTSNVGGNAYVEDLVEVGMNGTISGLGGSYTTGSYGANPKSNASLKTDISDVTKDFITVTIKPKHKGTASCTIKLPIQYPLEADASFYGSYGSSNNSYGSFGGNGGDGPDLIVKIKTAIHSETGETIYICRVNSVGSSTGSLYKLAMGGSFHVAAPGGSGGSGGPGRDRSANDGYERPDNGGDGGNGGNGGSIKLIIDPSAKDIKITYNVDGGSQGLGGIKGTCFSCSYGSDGNHGTRGSGGSGGSFSKEIKAVIF
ncbi:MAG: hypothetical protein ACI8ZM_005036 [Crocinitomix sp.]|jgi:hypothetical protein